VSDVSLNNEIELFKLGIFVAGNFVNNFENHEEWSNESEEAIG
jgi:hypothetical protein